MINRAHPRGPKTLVAALAGAAALMAASPAAALVFGDVDVLAQLPPLPGFPEGIAVDGAWAMVSTPARSGTAGTGPSVVYKIDRATGDIAEAIPLIGEDLSQEHALVGVSVDGDGRFYVLSTQLGIVRLTPVDDTYEQSSYASSFPDLPTCSSVPFGVPCSPTTLDLPPLLNDMVFDESGTAYVTDSAQATIYRVPPGGQPEIWFQSALFDPPPPPLNIGVNAVRLSPDRTSIYISATLFKSAIYRLPLVDDPMPGDLEIFHAYPGEAPDGIAFGRSGRLYVALAGSSQISVLSSYGVEVTRIATPLLSPAAFDMPASVAFDDATLSLLVTNHALATGDPGHFNVLRVFVNDMASPLVKPSLP